MATLTTPHYEACFQRLTLEEQARAADFARSRGFRLTCLSPEVESFPVVPIEVIPPEQITPENFPSSDPHAIYALRLFWQVPQKFPQENSYPPEGFTPSVSEDERAAAALLRFMVSSSDEAIELWGYPVERLPEPPKPEAEPQPEPRGFRGFLARLHS